MEDLTITINGFSKAYSMTGWRLGYVAGNKETMTRMLMLQQHSITHPTTFVEKAGITALRECDDDVEHIVKDYHEARDYFVSEINKTGVLSCERPKGAFYTFPRIKNKPMRSAQLADFLLDKARVLAVPGSAFGKYGEGYMRFVYARSKDELKKAVERIREATQ